MCDVILCPPATLIAELADKLNNSKILLGGQDCHKLENGPYTGDISAKMLKDAGAEFVILGHSERRIEHRETNCLVKEKTSAAHRVGLNAIVCIGETLSERRDGLTAQVIDCQLKESLPDSCTKNNVIIAYEPVWAIGTSLTPSPSDVSKIHARIRQNLSKFFKDGYQIRLLYGGSVKPENAEQFISEDNVNGVLVGGASLEMEEFIKIISCYSH